MRILVVEDNEKLARSIRKGLEQEGYAVEVSGDGIDAGERLDGAPGGFAAVVLDRMLPGMDGVALCRRLRSRGNRVPILFLTARDSVEDRVSGLDAGADDYLTKPFSLEELSARIRALLRRPRTPTSVVLRAGEVALDPGSREVTAGGHPVSLTAKEFGLLELLLRHPGQVLSREQIARHVWSGDFEADSNVLEVHVRNIRRKLAEAGHDEVIETVRGAGYRLRA
ncbi:MAG: response regulator transcription factor [Spirochaetia bacterium]